MVTRFNSGRVSIRPRGNRPECKKFERIARTLLGIAINNNKHRPFFIQRTRLSGGVDIVCQQTANKDHIIYIYVPMVGECMFLPPGITILTEDKYIPDPDQTNMWNAVVFNLNPSRDVINKDFFVPLVDNVPKSLSNIAKIPRAGDPPQVEVSGLFCRQTL